MKSQQNRSDAAAFVAALRAERGPRGLVDVRVCMPPEDVLLQRIKDDILRHAPRIASRGRRLVGGLIDLMLLGLVEKGMAAFLVAGASPVGPTPEDMQLAAFVITSVVATGYMVGCWLLFGATLGMRMAGVYVADARTQGPISGRQAWWRFVVWYLAGGLAFLVMLASHDPERRTWYDRAGGTVVLED